MGIAEKTVIFKILNIFFSLVLSIVLVLLGVLIPFYYSITGLTKPKAVVTVIQNIDYEEVIEETPSVKKVLSKYGIKSKAVNEIIKSKEAGELIEAYTDKATEILLDVPEDRAIDIPMIKEIVNEHLGDILRITEENINLKLNDNKVKNEVYNFINKNETAIKQSLPALEQARFIVKTVNVSTVIGNTMSWQFGLLLAFIGILIVTAICVMQRRNLRGFLWLAIISCIIIIILTLVIIYSQNSLVSRLAFKLSNFETEIIESAISICTDKIFIALFSAVFFGVFFFTVYFSLIIHRRILAKKQVENTEAPPAII